jgi:aldehyde:ferredoxin oxidoreductase
MSSSLRYLRIDVGTGDSSFEEIPKETYRHFVGGRGLGIDFLYRNVVPGTDPLGPQNKLILATGILAGTTAPGFSRWMAITLSPLTGGYARAVGGGKFGAYLKFCGLEFLVLEGQAETPSYVLIDEKGARILPATDLWGLDTEQTQKRLKEVHGERAQVATIGPAGELGVKFATITHEWRTASRCGVGTVMGSKRIKAVCLAPEKRWTPQLFAEAQFKEMVASHARMLKDHPRRKKMTALGTTLMTRRMEEMGVFPVKNFQEGRLPKVEELSAEAFETLKIADYGCYGCTTRCGNVFKVKEGPYQGAESEGPEYETIFSLGGEVGNTEIGSIIAGDRLCDLLGIDTISTGVAIGFAMELFEKGILTSKEVDGLDLSWGNHQSMIKLIEKIGRRQGVGRLLGEGVQRAAEKIGKGAEAYAMHCKGLELPGYEPRGAKAHGLSYATSNIGGSHMYGYARQEISGYNLPREVDRFTDQGKGDIAAYNQINKAREEILILCNFADSGITAEWLADLLKAASGVEEFGDPDYLDKVGERIVTLERCFNVREGFSREQDTLPKRMLEESLKNAGPATGEVYRAFDTLLNEYYSSMGYDRQGIPTREKLEELGLAWTGLDPFRPKAN